MFDRVPRIQEAGQFPVGQDLNGVGPPAHLEREVAHAVASSDPAGDAEKILDCRDLHELPQIDVFRQPTLVGCADIAVERANHLFDGRVIIRREEGLFRFDLEQVPVPAQIGAEVIQSVRNG